jgi:hypothetical protein
MTAVGHTRSFGDAGSMSGLLESGHGCAIYEYTPRLERDSRIHVEQHADHRGMPMPLKLYFGGHQVDVLEALDQWYGPDYRYIKVGATTTEACTSFASMSPTLNGS